MNIVDSLDSAPGSAPGGRALAGQPGTEAPAVVDVSVGPTGALEVLSQREVERLRAALPDLQPLFRRCALAVLSTGSETDDAAEIFDRYADFDIELVQRTRGLKLRVRNAPATAFVDGVMIEGIKEHLYAVLRDIVYMGTTVLQGDRFDLAQPRHITDAVFHVLRNGGVLEPGRRAQQVVCWGGHAISREEYDYSKQVGYQLGLRGFDIATGCGPGAMKGPMKGATIAHAKQRVGNARYLGLTEPGIIGAEPPNPIVNRLVILPDIEKRLEAFVRVAHGIVVFPGGVGTAEEILYLLGILLHPDNAGLCYPVVFTGPAGSQAYFELIDELVTTTLGAEARQLYEVVIDDPVAVARALTPAARRVRRQRRESGDAFYFNWNLSLPEVFQQPFAATHANMAALNLARELPAWQLAAQLRRAFSGIVAGNVKADGVRAIAAHGPFELRGDGVVIAALDRVLRAFVAQRRMKIAADSYVPCYRLAGPA